MRRFLLTTALICAALTAAAQDMPLQPLETEKQGRGFQGVGRLDLAGTGFCTGTLVGIDLVLTAAHCLFDAETGKPLSINDIRFMAGFRKGRAAAYRSARRAAVHPDYVFGSEDTISRVGTDLALVELGQPINQSGVTPIMVERGARALKSVSMISYAKDREEVPSLQSLCHVLAHEARVQVLSCDVDFGASGAPVFVVEGGVPRIISVVSAKAVWKGQNVALSVQVRDAVEMLRPQLSTAPGQSVAPPPKGVSVRSVQPNVRRMQGGAGAKFLRP